MVDDYDFFDAIRQGLNPLHLEVFLTGQKDVGSSTLKTFAIPKGNDGTLDPGSICLDETLKDLPKILPMTLTEDSELFDSFIMHATTSGSITEGLQCLEPCGDTHVNNGTTHNEQENEYDYEFQAGPSGLSFSIETQCNDNFHHGPENLSGPLASPVSINVASNILKDAYNFFFIFYNWFSNIGK